MVKKIMNTFGTGSGLLPQDGEGSNDNTGAPDMVDKPRIILSPAEAQELWERFMDDEPRCG